LFDNSCVLCHVVGDIANRQANNWVHAWFTLKNGAYRDNFSLNYDNVHYEYTQDIFVRIFHFWFCSSLLYGSEMWRLTGNYKRRVEATDMDALRRSWRFCWKVTYPKRFCMYFLFFLYEMSVPAYMIHSYQSL
jgi:hypothetical protein